MKTAIVYCSQTGHTKKYADWLAEELDCRALPYAERAAVDLSDMDLLVFCSWFHAASIMGAKWLKKVISAHPELELVLLATGANPMPCEEWPASDIENVFHRTFPEDECPELAHFYCQGGFDFDRLGMPDRIAMRMFFKANAKAAETDSKVAEMLRVMKAGFDGTRREYLEPVLDHIRVLTDAKENAAC